MTIRTVNIWEIQGEKMGDLKAKSDCFVFVFQCGVEWESKEFKKWVRYRALMYVFDLKEKTALGMNGTC